VNKSEIVEKHDYNLNIRRYVDNTPDPEPEDVHAHLIGGVPEAEVQARKSDFAKFGVTADRSAAKGREWNRRSETGPARGRRAKRTSLRP
jgi:hypothetical protein